jgi:hypothetical protein
VQVWRTIPQAGWWHLTVAVVLTLMSWVGYHNSVNRPRFVIGFPNLPLVQFVLDIAMVVVYGLAVFSVETATNRGQRVHTTLWPEAVLVSIAFVLYALWDRVALTVRKTVAYRDEWERAMNERPDLGLKPMRSADDGFDRKRRHVTYWCALFAAGLAVGAVAVDAAAAAEPPTIAVAVIDGGLILLLLGYRLAKEFVSEPRTALPVEKGGGG